MITNLFKTNEFQINGENLKVIRETKKAIYVTDVSIPVRIVLIGLTHKKVVTLPFKYDGNGYYSINGREIFYVTNTHITSMTSLSKLEGIISYEGRCKLKDGIYKPVGTIFSDSPDKSLLRQGTKII